MPSVYFSGNKAGSGGVLSVTFNSKDQSAFFRLTKQVGWNDTTKKPSFSGGAMINVKLSADEIGEFIHAIGSHDSCGFYHSFGEDVSTGTFRYYEVENKANPNKKNRGFGLTIKKGDVEIKIGLSLGAAERFSQYLQFALDHMNSAIYAQDKKEQEEYYKKKEGEKPKVVKPFRKEKIVEETTTKAEVEIEVDENVNPPEVVEEENTEDNLNW